MLGGHCKWFLLLTLCSVYEWIKVNGGNENGTNVTTTTTRTFELEFDVIIESNTVSSTVLLTNGTKQAQIVAVAHAAISYTVYLVYDINLTAQSYGYTFTFWGVVNNDDGNDDSNSQFAYDITVTFHATTHQLQPYLMLQTILTDNVPNITRYILDTFYYNNATKSYIADIDIIYDNGDSTTASPTSMPTDTVKENDASILGLNLSDTMTYLLFAIIALSVISIIMGYCACRYRHMSKESKNNHGHSDISKSVEMGLRDPGQPKGFRKNRKNSKNDKDKDSLIKQQNGINNNDDNNDAPIAAIVGCVNNEEMNKQSSSNKNGNMDDELYEENIGELPDLPIHLVDDTNNKNDKRNDNDNNSNEIDSPIASAAVAHDDIGGAGWVSTDRGSIHQIEGGNTQGNNVNVVLANVNGPIDDKSSNNVNSNASSDSMNDNQHDSDSEIYNNNDNNDENDNGVTPNGHGVTKTRRTTTGSPGLYGIPDSTMTQKKKTTSIYNYQQNDDNIDV